MEQNRVKRIAFFTPYWKQQRGNSTTAKRIVNGLQERGIDVFLFAYDEEEWSEEINKRVNQCDIIHILHFQRFLQWQMSTGYRLHTPYIITSGGTDINEDFKEETKRKRVIPLLEKAEWITVFTEVAKVELEDAAISTQVVVIPQGVWLPNASVLPKGKKDYPAILLPAGLRKVKDVLYALPVIERAKRDFRELTYTIIGEVLEAEVEKKVKSKTKEYEWFTYEPPVPFETIASVYANYDIVLNSSISEGQTAVLLEAMSCRIPVIARKNSGNESIIRDGENGFLFADEAELEQKLRQVIDDTSLQRLFVENGLKTLEQQHSLETEIQSYIRLYERAR
ncbi:glycosyltransferase family 4 protein [Bacillus alkalicellulosilyticus]|uniref:glycosyltransferase family 4 protein n=1 Tax=Alkalihalobacterium alkalicellulosilyticum TaxID=1912214 RepID=UPI000996D37E|nr:glycosyltransferase family 4 protein [Bacillus alkalicellulosilyticus]